MFLEKITRCMIIFIVIFVSISCSCSNESSTKNISFNNESLRGLNFDDQVKVLKDLDYKNGTEFVECIMAVKSSQDMGNCYKLIYSKTEKLYNDRLKIINSQEKLEKFCKIMNESEKEERVKVLMRRNEVAMARTRKYVGDPGNKQVTEAYFKFLEEYAEKPYAVCPEE